MSPFHLGNSWNDISQDSQSTYCILFERLHHQFHIHLPRDKVNNTKYIQLLLRLQETEATAVPGEKGEDLFHFISFINSGCDAKDSQKSELNVFLMFINHAFLVIVAV